MTRACIVVPTFNHTQGIRALLPKLSGFGVQTIVVNDGSSPSQTAELHRFAEDHAWVHVVDHRCNQGKGAAVMSGLREAAARNFSHALQIDADGQHDTADIPKFLQLSAEHRDAVIVGQPIYDESVPKVRLLARYLTHFWVWVETLSFSIRDSMCGFRVYPVAAVMDVLRRSRVGRRMDFDPEILVRLSWQGVPVLSVPTRVTYPEDGKSHFRMLDDNLLISYMHLRLVLGMLWRAPMLLARRIAG